jgi:hypothetical protein
LAGGSQDLVRQADDLVQAGLVAFALVDLGVSLGGMVDGLLGCLEQLGPIGLVAGGADGLGQGTGLALSDVGQGLLLGLGRLGGDGGSVGHGDGLGAHGLDNFRLGLIADPHGLLDLAGRYAGTLGGNFGRLASISARVR